MIHKTQIFSYLAFGLISCLHPTPEFKLFSNCPKDSKLLKIGDNTSCIYHEVAPDFSTAEIEQSHFFSKKINYWRWFRSSPRPQTTKSHAHMIIPPNLKQLTSISCPNFFSKPCIVSILPFQGFRFICRGRTTTINFFYIKIIKFKILVEKNMIIIADPKDLQQNMVYHRFLINCETGMVQQFLSWFFDDVLELVGFQNGYLILFDRNNKKILFYDFFEKENFENKFNNKCQSLQATREYLFCETELSDVIAYNWNFLSPNLSNSFFKFDFFEKGKKWKKKLFKIYVWSGKWQVFELEHHIVLIHAQNWNKKATYHRGVVTLNKKTKKLKENYVENLWSFDCQKRYHGAGYYDMILCYNTFSNRKKKI